MNEPDVATSGTSNALYGPSFADRARAYIGTPYKWGGPTCETCNNDPQNGLDCSGLIYQAAADLGVRIPRTASKQHAASTAISREECERTPGALVFLRRQADKTDSAGNVIARAGSIVHVGMSLGDGTMVEAWFNNKVVNPRFGWWDRSYSAYPSYYCKLNGVTG